MTRENPLTHHEKLRYDYLLKNIHYLNDKEKREFAFLQAKLDGPQENSEPFNPEERSRLFQSPVSTCRPMLTVVDLIAEKKVKQR